MKLSNWMGEVCLLGGLASACGMNPSPLSQLDGKSKGVSRAHSALKTFVCKSDLDRVSKSFRPKSMTDDIRVRILVGSLLKVAKIEVTSPSQKPLIGSLKSISGDEGYTEFEVPSEISTKYGFEYVNVSYEEDYESGKITNITHASLIHGGEFATCK